jgi:hypothetical protein
LSENHTREEPRRHIGGAADPEQYDQDDGARGQLRPGIAAFLQPFASADSLNKSLNGLHNPVTLHVVCQYMLLRSDMEARSVT